MRVAILETVAMQGGHEVEFDRLIVQSLRENNHEPLFFVPTGFSFKVDYGTDVVFLKGGSPVTHSNAKGFNRLWLSILRSVRRVLWFSDALRAIHDTHCDAVIIPSATPRFIQSILHSKLRFSSVPIHVLLHGIEPKNLDCLVRMAKKCASYPNIQLKLLTLSSYKELIPFKNIQQVPPQVFSSETSSTTSPTRHRPLRLGFFGWYRKEKNLEALLESFVNARFTCDVRFVIQAIAQGDGAKEGLEELIQKYKANPRIEFIPKMLIGKDWESALLDVDSIVLPYAEKWHRHKWSAMLFNALGLHKPVFISEDINPELLQSYPCGMAFPLEDKTVLQERLETFVNSFDERLPTYTKALSQLNEDFSPSSFIQRVLGLKVPH